MEAGKSGNIRMPNRFDTDSLEEFEENLGLAIDNAFLLTNDTNTIQYAAKVKKVYFAGPWFDKRAGEFYYACESIYSMCEDYSKYEAFFPKQQVNITPKDAFDKNVENIKDCDLVIALVSRKDVGTAWEIGMAFALGKRIILVGYDDSTFLSHTNVMLAFTGECVPLTELANVILDNEYDTINIPNLWEGIE